MTGRPKGARARRLESARIVVDPISCDGVGICAHLAPDVITPDTWGYPIVAKRIAPEQLRQARAAVKGCPRRALHWIAD